MAILLSCSSSLHLQVQPKPLQNPKPCSSQHPKTLISTSKRDFIFQSLSLCIASLTLQPQTALSATPSKSILSGISNTKSWFQFFGDGFCIRVPPQFEDIMEPEDFNAGLSLYGDKAKPKTFAARFASSDGSEVVSVIIKPSNQLKITFLEAQDVTDLGSLKEAAKIFIPGGATIYAARTIKIKEDEGFRHLLLVQLLHNQSGIVMV